MSIDELAPVAAELQTTEVQSHLLQRIAVGTAKTLGCVGAGALIGLGIAEHTPAHVEIAGNDASVWLKPGHAYDQYSLDGAITGEIATSRQVYGEPVGVQVRVNFDTSALLDDKGNFNTGILPAYIQQYSDKEQIMADTTSSLEEHYRDIIGFGALGGLAVAVGTYGYKRWRQAYNDEHGLDQTTAQTYHAPERRAIKRIALGTAVLSTLATIPASAETPDTPKTITPNPAFDGTPLEGLQITGPLEPVVRAVQNYIEEYFKQTDAYYGQEEDMLATYLQNNPITIPTGAGVANLEYVTDRHCNDGMDRIIMAIAKHYGLHTLLSGGDDYLNSNVDLPGCTSNLADKTKRAKMRDIFAGGNHGSKMTAQDEEKQGITTLNGQVVRIEDTDIGVIGSPDPRVSNIGVPLHLINPNYTVEDQGRDIGEAACKAKKMVIAILHDPAAGQEAIKDGCGYILLALDGHTHTQAGPTPVDINLPNPGSQIRIGQQFTGGSAGGAPGPHEHDGNPLDDLTVGPLRHNAYIYIVSVDPHTGELIAITSFKFLPDQTLDVSQDVVNPLRFTTASGKVVNAQPK